MAGLRDLSREYEARRYPPQRRLDLQAEGPRTGRERALRWIEMWAHEEPGAELLLVLERGRIGPTRPGSTRAAVEALLEELRGGLLDWWQPFTPGTLALRIALEPRRVSEAPQQDAIASDDGRIPETGGAAYLAPDRDIPPELLPLATRAAELRATREELSAMLIPLLTRRIWIEAESLAMSESVGWGDALARIVAAEERRAYED